MKRIDIYFLFLLFACSESEVDENKAPSKPVAISPLNAAESQVLDLTLKWFSTDPDNDPITFDVYFDDDNASELVVSNITVDSYRVSGLKYETIYKWKVSANDNNGNSSVSDEFSFTTIGIQGKWEILHISKTQVIVYDPDQLCSATNDSSVTARIDIVGQLYRRWIGEYAPPQVNMTDTLLTDYALGSEENNKGKLGIENLEKHYIHPDSIVSTIRESTIYWPLAIGGDVIGSISTFNDSILTISVGGIGKRSLDKEHILVELDNRTISPFKGLPGFDTQQRVAVADINCDKRVINFYSLNDIGEAWQEGETLPFDEAPTGELP